MINSSDPQEQLGLRLARLTHEFWNPLTRIPPIVFNGDQMTAISAAYVFASVSGYHCIIPIAVGAPVDGVPEARIIISQLDSRTAKQVSNLMLSEPFWAFMSRWELFNPYTRGWVFDATVASLASPELLEIRRFRELSEMTGLSPFMTERLPALRKMVKTSLLTRTSPHRSMSGGGRHAIRA